MFCTHEARAFSPSCFTAASNVFISFHLHVERKKRITDVSYNISISAHLMHILNNCMSNSNLRGSPSRLLQKPCSLSPIGGHPLLPPGQEVAHVPLLQWRHFDFAQVIACRVPRPSRGGIPAIDGSVRHVPSLDAMPIAPVVRTRDGDEDSFGCVVAIHS